MHRFFSNSSLLLLLILLLVGCNADPCKEIQCENGGACIQRGCQCAPGFSGENCEIDDCTLLDCQNGGTCETGVCDCPMEYYGRECELRTTEKFAGVYSAENECITQIYTVIFSSGNDANEVVVYNMRNDNFFFSAYLEDENNLSFFDPDLGIAGEVRRITASSFQVNYTDNFGLSCELYLRPL